MSKANKQNSCLPDKTSSKVYTPDDLVKKKQEILQAHNWKYLTSARAKLLLKGENHE